MKEESKHNDRKSDLAAMGNDLMKKMDEFFYSQPSKNILDSIDSFFQQQAPFGNFPVDMYETDKEWVVKADLPGASKDDIYIDVIGDQIKIGVSNDEEFKQHNEKTEYYRRERRYSKTERTIRLPYQVDKKRTKASFNKGVLELRGPKQKGDDYRLTID